jgi:DNA-binding transcriptional ArsR family regulator
MQVDFTLAELAFLANRFKILGEPARLQILAELCQRELKVQEICERTGLQQSNVSKHLRLMKDAGLVTCRREGVWRYYQLADPELIELCLHRKQIQYRLPAANSVP